MADVEFDADFDPAGATLVEGLPGAGLVGKIAADHLVDSFEMAQVGAVHCDGLPDVAVYHRENPTVLSPVRLYADPDRELIVLQSDVPVSPSQARDFAGCVTAWLDSRDVTPLYLSGLPEGKEDVPELYGVSTGGAGERLEAAGIAPPDQGGVISGPTGALLAHAGRASLAAVGLVVETDPQFPDPEAARKLISGGIEPLADIEVPTDALVEKAEEIRDAREQLAKRMQEAEDESSQAQPLRGFQ
jgi:uncharacterized protein